MMKGLELYAAFDAAEQTGTAASASLQALDVRPQNNWKGANQAVSSLFFYLG